MRHLARIVFTLALIALLGGCTSQRDPRAEFLRVIDRPRVPLNANSKVATLTKADVETYAFSFAADMSQRVPGVLVKPEHAGMQRFPVVIALHGTGGNCHDEMPLLMEFAAKGFIGVAIDGRYHGERCKAGKGSDEYQDAIVRAWREPGKEHPFYYDTVWDVMRLIDYLQTRDDVDPKRIGLIGFSKGGIETYLAAAVDERIAVAIPCIGVQSFQWALEHDAWRPRVGTIQKAWDTVTKEAGVEQPDAAFVRSFYDRVVPGIADEFDGPKMLPLIAPRPLMVINGDSDDKTPVEGLKLCTDAARRAYAAQGAEDRFVVKLQEKTGHKVNADSREAAVAWFEKWLKPRSP